MGNRDSIDKLHSQIPKVYKTRVNKNWKTLVEAIGLNDQMMMDLLQAVRDQMFVNSANRPYLDRLGANVKVNRPPLTGMDDPTLRRYIPVMAYQPKQVKLIFDMLLDIFFARDATTAFIQSTGYDTFALVDGWELEYLVDGVHEEKILFYSSDFTNILSATPEEVASAINRKAQYSFAIVQDDRLVRRKFIRIFTKTIGAKGSLQITGGRSNFVFMFPGWVDNAGSGSGTIWDITKIGDEIIFTHVGGENPHIENVLVGDVAILNIPGNMGAFIVESIDLVEARFSIRNLLGTPGVFEHALYPGSFVRFQRPYKSVVFNVERRAITWEVKPGEIVIEMPATPPVVRRQLKGSAHINGLSSTMISRDDDSTLTMSDISDWPTSGQFVIQPLEEIVHHNVTISEDTVDSYQFDTRFCREQKYSYTNKVGNTIYGITPPLPDVAGIYEADILTFSRDIDRVVTVELVSPLDLDIGRVVQIRGTAVDSGIVNADGTITVSEVVSPTVFKFVQPGDVASGTGGVAQEEHKGLAATGSIVHLMSAISNTGIYGPYIWDSNALFVLSSLNTELQTQIFFGDNLRLINVSYPNQIPNEEGYLIFDYGMETQEGPVRYFSKPNASTLQIDPSHTFQFDHGIGSNVTMIRRRGAHILSGAGKEYSLYVTDPAVARDVLKQQIELVKSLGIFLNFLVRYPQQLYASLDVYKSDNPDLWPISQDP